MQLDERFRLCLLSLASRYPHCLVDMNEVILGPQRVPTKGWTCHELIIYFQRTTPEVLDARVSLILNARESNIYLLDCSLDIPALWVHRPTNKHPWLEEEVAVASAR
jgi:hypothetical protein